MSSADHNCCKNSENLMGCFRGGGGSGVCAGFDTPINLASVERRGAAKRFHK